MSTMTYDKINIRKVTNLWSSLMLQGLLEKNLCSLSSVFLFWNFSLMRHPKSLSDKFIVFYLEVGIPLETWRKWFSINVIQHQPRPEKTHFNFRKVIYIMEPNSPTVKSHSCQQTRVSLREILHKKLPSWPKGPPTGIFRISKCTYPVKSKAFKVQNIRKKQTPEKSQRIYLFTQPLLLSMHLIKWSKLWKVLMMANLKMWVLLQDH